MENLESRYMSCDKKGATFDNEATFVVVKSDQLKRAWVTLFLLDEVCVVRVRWVCVCEKHLAIFVASPPHTFLCKPTTPEITGVALECVVRILSGIFHLMERTDLHSLTIREQTFTQPGRIANVVLLQRLKHKNTPREKKPIQITSFIPKTQRFWFYINLLEYTLTFF